MALECKAIWVKDGHNNPEPSCYEYAGVVSHDIIRIALTAALNNLPVFVC